MNCEIRIINGNNIYFPSVVDGITLETSRYGEPGILKFTCLKDSVLELTEGNAVAFLVDNKSLFFGFIFIIKRNNSNQLQITAYDQLRYLKNKDSYIYTDKRADEVIKMIAKDYKLNVGTISNTKYKIAKKAEDNMTLFDICQNALDETLRNTNKLFVLFDDYGKLMLKNVEDMKLDLLIDSDTAQTFDYTSGINDNTYNQIKLTYDNDETGKREVYMTKSSTNINKWGVLQYYESINNPQGAAEKAKALLKLYNEKTRNLKISGAFGDTRLRAGCSVVVKLNLGDVNLRNYMLVEKVKHSFKYDLHTMDLTVRGGVINSA